MKQNYDVVEGDKKINVDEYFTFEIGFDIPSKYDAQDVKNYVKKGDTATIVLGKGINSLHQGKENITVDLPDGKEAKLGTYQFVQNGENLELQILFDAEDGLLNNRNYNNFKAEATAKFKIDSTKIPSEDGEITIYNNTYKTLVPTVTTIGKTGEVNPENNSIKWTIEVTAKRAGKDVDLAGYKIKDDLTSVGEYKENTFKVKDVVSTPSIQDKVLKYEFPNGSMSPQVLTFETALTPQEFLAKDSETKKTNIVELLNKNDKFIKSDSTSLQWKPNWISKNARKNSEDGQNYFKEGEDHYIYWEIIVNGFEENFSRKKTYAHLEDVKIEDILQEANGFYRKLEYISSILEEFDETSGKWTKKSDITPANNVYSIGNIDGKRVRLTIKSKIISPDPKSMNRFRNVANIWWKGINKDEGIKTESYFHFGQKGISKSSTEWIGSEAIWTIKVDENAVNENSRVYDMMIHNANMSYAEFNNEPGEENYRLKLRNGNIDIDKIHGINIDKLRPEGLEFVKLDMQEVEKLNQDTGLKFVKHEVFDTKGRYVADLLEVTGFKEKGKYEFKVKGRLVEPRILINSIYTTDVYNNSEALDTMSSVNTAYLIDDNQSDDYISSSSWTLHASKMLEKSALTAIDAEKFKSSYDSSILNQNMDDNKDSAFNHKTKSVIYKLSINADQNKNTKDSLGKLTLTDILPDGWEFVNIKDDSKYLVYEGEPIKGTTALEDLMSFDARVRAIGNPISLNGLDVKTENDNKMIFTFDNIDKAYVIVLEAKIKDEELKKYIFESSDAINTATLESEKSGPLERKGKVTKQQAAKINTVVLDKNHDKAKENGILRWTVNYKPYDIITPEGDTNIYLQDTMSEGMELRKNADGSLDFSNDNIVIEEIELSADGTITSISKLKQSEVENLVSYDAKERNLNLDVKDHKKAYRFTYTTDIFANSGDRITNAVNIIGSNLNIPKPIDSKYEVKDIDFTATMQRNPWMEIKKVDSTDNNMALEDAHFGLFEIGNDKPIRNGVTNKNGRLIFNAIPDGEYILKEIQAPSGYQLDETAYTVKVNRGVSSGEPVVSINGKTDKTSHQITIENSKTTSPQPQADGQIKVSKKVTDTTQKLDKEFEFSLVLTDLPENSPEEYAYEKTGEEKGNLVKAEDKYQFKLSNGQEIVIKGLPRTARYEIKEKDYSSENYITTAINNIGTIVDNEEIKVEFINKKELLPQVTTNAILQINKKIVGTGISGEDKFKFKIFFDTDPTKEYSYKINGILQSDKLTNEKEFELQGEQSIVIEGIADKERFTIKETDYLDYTPEKETITVDITTETIVNMVNFINQKDKVEPENGKLRVKKIVRGNGGDREREFEFTVKIGTDANASYKYIGENIESGLIKGEDVIKLKHGQSIIIQDIPIGTEYTVTEADYTSDGYETKVIGNSGLISITESTAEFTNTRQISSNTGGGGDGGNTPEPKPEPKPSPKPEPEPNPETPKPTTETPKKEEEETPKPEKEENQTQEKESEPNQNPISRNEVPSSDTKPPTGVPFIPKNIIGNRTPEKTVILTIVDEKGIPIGKAEVNLEEGNYVFIEDDRVPQGKAKIHDDNTLEILDEETPKAFPKKLPKTGNEQDKYYLMGLILLTIGIVLRKRKK